MGKVALELLACLLLVHQTLSQQCSGGNDALITIPACVERPNNHVTSRRVGFSVSLSANVGPSSTMDIVIWDTVFTNVGNAFSETTGKFTAPMTGTYFFTLSIHKRRGLAAPFVRVLVDGVHIFSADECCDEDPYDSSTNSVLLTLNQGQEVWTELYPTRVLATRTHDNTFTGFLVFA